MTDKLYVVKLSPFAVAPARPNPSSPGFDLYSAYDYTIPATCKMTCKTDIQISCEEGSRGRIITSKSEECVIGRRNIVRVNLFNYDDQPFSVRRGDVIAQLVIEKVIYPELCVSDLLDVTVRDVNRFK